MKISRLALKKDFTHILCINENQKKLFSLTFCVLRTGPTVSFRIRNYIPSFKLYNKGNPSGYWPELIIKNFNTALGRRYSRALGSLFPAKPEFTGRTVLTLRN